MKTRFFPSIRGLIQWIKICRTWEKAIFLKAGVLRKDLIFKMRNGLKLNLIYEGPDDTTTMLKDLYINNSYNLKKINLNKFHTIVDIGANQGYVSTYMAKINGNCKIYSYEPSKRTFHSLLKNIKLNNFDEVILPFNAAISEKKGEAKMYLGEGNAGHSLIKKRLKDYEIVDSIRLSDIFEQNHLNQIDLLKVDCEGSEYGIFFSTPSKYFKKIRVIIMELHKSNQNKPEELKLFLENQGFKIKKIKENEIYAINKIK